jgi:hypothetical protein
MLASAGLAAARSPGTQTVPSQRHEHAKRAQSGALLCATLAGPRRPPQGPAAPAAKLTPNAGGLGVSAALPRWLALHRVDRRSRAQACAPPCRHRQPVHGQPPADRARACDIDARPQCSSLRGGTHQAPAASGKARAAQGSNALRTSCDVKWRYSRDEREHMFSVALDESRANTLDRRQLVRRARS